MLSLAAVTPHHGRTYYQQENYYTKAESTEFSNWAGTGAKEAGLEGVVEPKRFEKLLYGKDANLTFPESTGGKRRAGVDLTFSAPKSISVQSLVYGDERLIHAHREAVRDALDYVEKNYAAYRVGPKKAREVRIGQGIIVAQFEHDTSRLKDPQLHTHNVVLNRVVDDNGKARAMHNDLLFRDSKLIGLVYQNSLAMKARRLGYGIRQNRNGTFELEGYSDESLRVFSKRREQLEKLGATTQKSARGLVYKDRKAKEGPQTRKALVDGWRKEANDAGLAKVRSKSRRVNATRSDVKGVIEASIRQAAERDVVFRSQKVMEAALSSTLGRHSLEELEGAIRVQVGQEIVSTKTGEWTTKSALACEAETRHLVKSGVGTFEPLALNSEILRRVDGLVALDAAPARKAMDEFRERAETSIPDASRWPEHVRTLEGAVALGKRLQPAQLRRIRDDIFESIQGLTKAQKKTHVAELMAPIEREFQSATKGQTDAIARTLSSKDQVIVWEGVAGAGKTFSMRQIVNASAKAGFEVTGLAPSAAAAIQLSKDAGIPATTLQSHLLAREKVTAGAKGKLWIVDEAGMVSSKEMLALMRKAKIHHARVLLVGDTRQLSPIDQGNPFLDLQRNTLTTRAVLNESVRQKDRKLRDAVARMNVGKVDVALEHISDSTTFRKTAQGRMAFVLSKFLDLSESERNSTLILARTNAERGETTNLIREALKSRGILRNETTFETFARVDLPVEKLKFTAAYAVGDLIVPNRTYQNLGLAKDAAYEVLAKDGETISLKHARGVTRVKVRTHNAFSVHRPLQIAVAEGDRMIWNRNVKSKGQLNNRAFQVVGVSGDEVTIRTDTGEVRMLNRMERQFAEHAWVMTVHKAQGQTRDRVIQLVDHRTLKKDLLVGVTRAVNEVALVASSADALRAQARRDTTKRTATEEVDPTVRSQVEEAVARDSTSPSQRRGSRLSL
jgi:conjugative relaxase-like TrwC/TraI family protein